MPVSFQILQDQGLVYIKMTGTVRAQDSFDAFGDYAQHPHFQPGQNQLIDMTGVTTVEHNYPELMKMQARKADILTAAETETLLVYLAPSRVSVDLATTILKSWVGVPDVNARVAVTEEEALDILGVSATSISTLLKVGS